MKQSAYLKIIPAALLTGVLITLGILNLRDRATWTDVSDGVFWIESDDGLQAEEVSPEGAGYCAGIRVGDRLLAVNDQPVHDMGVYAEILYACRSDAALSYTVATAAGVRIIPISLTVRPLFSARDGLKTLLAFLYLGIGIFAFWRGIRQPRVWHFYFLCLTSFVLWLFSYTPELSVLDWLAYVLSGAAFLLLPALFLHFCLRFPVDTRIGKRQIFLLYLPAGLLGLTHCLWAAGRLAPLGLARTVGGGKVIDSIELVFFCAVFIACGWLLLKRRRQAKDMIVRQQMKWISYGTLAGIAPFSLIYLIPALLGMRTNFVMDASILFLSLIPLSVGYAVVRYRLMDVEDIARQAAANLIAGFALLTAYIPVALIAGSALRGIVPQGDLLAAVLAFLLPALLFAPLRGAIRTRLDRAFYQERFQNRATLLEFARTLGSEISLEPLSRSILERIFRTFPVDAAALFLAEPSRPGTFRFADGLSYFPSPGRLIIREDSDELRAEGLFGLPQGPDYLHCAGDALTREGFRYTQDMRFQGRRVGILALGDLPTGRHFTSEDIEMLSALAGYAAIALENAALYRSVTSKAAELERLKNHTENILESIDIAILAITAAGRARSCNRAFESLYGVDRRRIIGAAAEDIFSYDALASIRQATGNSGWHVASPANISKLSLRGLNGRELIVNLSVIPLRHSDRYEGCLLVLDDLTVKTRLEEQLRQAEKLSSIGLLAAGVAHEINTPIAGISSYTQMLLKKEDMDAPRRKKILEKIEKQTFRAAEIVSGLLNFSRLGGSEFSAVDVNQIIHDSLSLLNHQFERNHIRVVPELESSLPPIRGNTGKLQQVFVNLFLNARDAMPLGGELAIHTGMNDSAVVINVSDTGAGIPKENLSRIFDPFFTTKGIGQGTGLGLAISYGIIQEHGGGIFVESASGQGTRFTLKLPARLN